MSASPLSIVHVCRSGWPAIGGLEAAVAGLAREQARVGHDVRVVTLDRDAGGVRLHACEHEGVRWLRHRRIGPRRYPFAGGLAAAVSGADVAHVHGVDGLADVLVHGRRRHGVPVGISTHGGYLHTSRHRQLKQGWLRTVTRWTFAAADAVWFTSEADRRCLAAAGRTGPVLPNGVDVERFRGLARRPERGRWLVVGRLDAHKGLGDLLDVLAHLSRGAARPFFVEVIGREARPGLQQRLESRARELGLADRLSFRGEVPAEELGRALARAELALFPSRAEGFGIAALESMAAGVPVVVSAAPALQELVEPEVSGYVVDFRAPAEAAARLASLHGADHVQVGERGAARAERYAWPAVRTAYDAAYRAVLAR